MVDGGLRRSRCGGLLVTSGGSGDFRFWILDGGLAVLLRALRLRRDESSFALRDYGVMQWRKR
jgi:hypothetical protein